MPKLHGAVLKAGESPICRLGIWQVFDPWVDPHLQFRQGYTALQFIRPHRIEFHFRRVLHRLPRSLARLHQQFREWDGFLALDDQPVAIGRERVHIGVPGAGAAAMGENETTQFVIDAHAETYRKRHAATQEPTANAARLTTGYRQAQGLPE